MHVNMDVLRKNCKNRGRNCREITSILTINLKQAKGVLFPFDIILTGYIRNSAMHSPLRPYYLKVNVIILNFAYFKESTLQLSTVRLNG